IDKIILDDFPGFHMLTVAERDSDTRAFILAHFAKRNPSVVRADFDGDGHPDYAVLLKNKKSGVAKFVILLCPEDEHCKKACDEDITSYAGEVFIKDRSDWATCFTDRSNRQQRLPATSKASLDRD